MAKKDLVVNIDSKTKGLEQGMSKSVNEVRKLETQTRKSKNEFKQFDDRIGKLASGNLTGLLGTMGSVAGAVAIAKLAQEGFNKTMRASQEHSDNFDRSIMGAKGGVDFFFQSLNTGDWSNFFNNMSTAIIKSRELYDALDALSDMRYAEDYLTAEEGAKISEYRAKLRDPSTTEEDREIIKKDTQKILDEQLARALRKGEQAKEAKILAFQVATKMPNTSEEDIKLLNTIFGGQYEDEMESAIYFRNERLKLEKRISGRFEPGDSPLNYDIDQDKKYLEQIKEKQKALEEIVPGITNAANAQKLYMESGMDDVNKLQKEQYGAVKAYWDAQGSLNRLLGISGSKQTNGGTTASTAIIFDEGSIANIDEKIKNLNKKISLSIDDEDRKTLNKELNKLEREKRIIIFKYKYEGDFDPNEKIDKPNTSATVTPMGAIKPITLPIVNEVSEQISSMELWNETMNKIREDNWGTIESFNGISMAMSAIGDSAEGGAAQMFKWAASTLSAIGQAIPAIMALVAVKETEANANAKVAVTGVAASVASIPIVGSILAVAAITSVVASMASIPKFAEGGLVYGNTIAQVGEYAGASNNPEVIAPLSKLRDILADTQGGIGGVVDFRIAGKDLFGTLNNYSSKQNKK